MSLNLLKKTVTIIFLFLFLTTAALADVFINELHYDNDGTDTDEGVEIAGDAGSDLTGWTVAFYTGSNGTVYATLALTGSIDDEGSGFGALWFAQSGVQNGAPDGLALVDPTGGVIQFLSYEGTFTATDGPANGMLSTDIGISEPSSTPVGETLQLIGTGSVYADFSWSGPATHSRGSINSGQTFEAVTTTTVYFTNASASIAEDGGSIEIYVSISNPSAAAPTSADVVLISGNAADIENYTTQSVNFTAASSDDQSILVSITDDSDIEGDEVLIFELQNISGGNEAAAGNPSQFNLTIEDNDFSETPNIVINEIMQNPSAVLDGDGEWLELYNPGLVDVDINGWTIKDDGSDSHVIDNGGPLVISAGGYLVLGINDTLATNGGTPVDYMYSSWFLSNSDDEVVLVYSDGVTEVDRVNYDGGPTFPDPAGASMELRNPSYDNNDGANWGVATAPYGDGDLGTPGAENSIISAIERTNNPALNNFKLYANYPNPFNPSTTLRFDVPAAVENLELAVYDILGKRVQTLYSGSVLAGQFSAQWNGVNQDNLAVPSGVYFAVLKTQNFSQSIKMMLLK